MLKLAAALAGAVLLASCGDDRQTSTPAPRPAAVVTATPAPAHTPAPRRPLRRPRCRHGVADCASTSGTIVYVERVDPDGDGDLHVALLSRQSLTYPGISVVKFERRVRPAHVPAIGSWMTAVGERYTGTHDDRNLRVERYRR